MIIKKKSSQEAKTIREANDAFLAFMENLPAISNDFAILGEVKNNVIHLAKKPTYKLKKAHYSAYSTSSLYISILDWPTIPVSLLQDALGEKSKLTICKKCYQSVQIANKAMGFQTDSRRAELNNDEFLERSITYALIDTYHVQSNIKKGLPASLKEVTAEEIISLWKNYLAQLSYLQTASNNLSFETLTTYLKLPDLKEEEVQFLLQIQSSCKEFLEETRAFLTAEKTQSWMLDLFPGNKNPYSVSNPYLIKIIYGTLPNYNDYHNEIEQDKANGIKPNTTAVEKATIAALLNILQLPSSSKSKNSSRYFALCMNAHQESRVLSYFPLIRSTHSPTDKIIKQEVLDLALLFFENSRRAYDKDFLEALAAAQVL